MAGIADSLLAKSDAMRQEDAANLEKQTELPDTQRTARFSPNQGGSQNSSQASPAKTMGKAVRGAAQGFKKVATVVPKILGSFKEGGTVPETGNYKLHEGEEVIPASRASEYRKVWLGRKANKSNR